MIKTDIRSWIVIIVACGLLGGCAGNWRGASANAGGKSLQEQALKASAAERQKSVLASKPDLTCRVRVVTNSELLRWSRKDPALTPEACRKILARLNNRAEYIIFDAIAKGTPLKAPNDFLAYRDWTPMPRVIPALKDQTKLILVVKDHPFLGWYQNGRLLGDAFAGIGRPGERTKTGLFRVLHKDANHYSGSYSNAYGAPAWMPWALRIYGLVWIHAGDITGPYSSHGCVMLPPGKATDLYRWADKGTPVLIISSLADLNTALTKFSGAITVRTPLSSTPRLSLHSG